MLDQGLAGELTDELIDKEEAIKLFEDTFKVSLNEVKYIKWSHRIGLVGFLEIGIGGGNCTVYEKHEAYEMSTKLFKALGVFNPQIYGVEIIIRDDYDYPIVRARLFPVKKR